MTWDELQLDQPVEYGNRINSTDIAQVNNTVETDDEIW